MKLYERGQDRIESELNIVKIMKSMRDMKILMKNSLMDNQIRYQIKHSEKNILNLDSTSSEEEFEIDQKQPQHTHQHEKEPQHTHQVVQDDQAGCEEHFHIDDPNGGDPHQKKGSFDPNDI